MKLRVAILFGGKSAEHEVSLQSAKNIVAALDRDRFDPVLIGIDKEGAWRLGPAGRFLLNGDDPKRIALNKSTKTLSVVPGSSTNPIVAAGSLQILGKIDVVFPVLHGPYGEDGSMQGLLKMVDLPFVGPGVLGSAVGMDKDVMKRLLRDAGIPVADFLACGRHQREALSFEAAAKVLGAPMFVKPANLGSSIGISKVASPEQFGAALEEAFKYDRKIVIESNVIGREIECAVLGNENPQASVPGEVIANAAAHGFYSYAAKYIDGKGAELRIPADLPPGKAAEIQTMAVRTFQVLCCEGMARVDLFLKSDGSLVVNEINTIPGFTFVSMYPKLWEASGIGFTELISRLIDLARSRHAAEKALKTTVE